MLSSSHKLSEYGEWISFINIWIHDYFIFSQGDHQIKKVYAFYQLSHLSEYHFICHDTSKVVRNSLARDTVVHEFYSLFIENQ